jgi:hypothetical protein
MKINSLLVLTFLGVVLAQSASPSQSLQVNPKANIYFGIGMADVRGNIYFPWQEDKTIFLKKWDGAKWSLLANGISGGTGDLNTVRASVSQNGKVYLAWIEQRAVLVATPNGAKWSLVGRPAAQTVKDYYLSIATDSKNNPVVAYRDDIGFVRVSRWTGQAWQEVGSAIKWDNELLSTNPSIAISKTDQIFVMWKVTVPAADGTRTTDNISVSTWINNKWTTLGNKPVFEQNERLLGGYSFTVSVSGQPIVAWQEAKDRTSKPQIFVKSWNGNTWEALGSNVIVAEESSLYDGVRLFMDPKGTLTLFYGIPNKDGSDKGSKIVGKRWIGNKWVSVGEFQIASSVAGQLVDVRLDKNGNSVIAWAKDIGGRYSLLTTTLKP